MSFEWIDRIDGQDYIVAEDVNYLASHLKENIDKTDENSKELENIDKRSGTGEGSVQEGYETLACGKYFKLRSDWASNQSGSDTGWLYLYSNNGIEVGLDYTIIVNMTNAYGVREHLTMLGKVVSVGIFDEYGPSGGVPYVEIDNYGEFIAKISSNQQYDDCAIFFPLRGDLGTDILSIGAHAEGIETKAVGAGSHAENMRTVAGNDYTHVEGIDSQALGWASHAEGHTSRAFGAISHAEGWATTKAEYSHAEGYGTIADEGAKRSHVEGDQNKVTALGSHAEGQKNTASGIGSHAEGIENNSEGNGSHVEGCQNNTESLYSHAEGWGSNTKGIAAHAEGNSTAEGDYSHSEGKSTTAKGKNAHAEGHGSSASADNAHAEGESSIASGQAAHAEGSSYARKEYAHAEGLSSNANAKAAHAEGWQSQVTGIAAHAEGYSQARGDYSHAEGYDTHADHYASHASGYCTKTSRNHQFVVGKFNEDDPSAIFIIGCGTSESDRQNAFVVKEDGTAYLFGKKIITE